MAYLDGARVGIEVTELHPDDWPSTRGSQLRKAEEQAARRTRKIYGEDRPYGGFWINPDIRSALQARIQDKVERARKYNKSRLNELWLLIVCQIPASGAIASTWVQKGCVSSQLLNAATGDLLASSPFDEVFLLLVCDGIAYRWTRASGWQIASEDAGPADDSASSFSQVIHDPEWLADPKGKCAAEIQKCLAEFRQQRKV